jgi:hypothetical protein
MFISLSFNIICIFVNSQAKGRRLAASGDVEFSPSSKLLLGEVAIAAWDLSLRSKTFVTSPPHCRLAFLL